MKHASLLALIILLPSIALAQNLSVQGFITSFLAFSNTVLIPFLLGFAFLFFVFNAIRFFVAGGANEKDRTAAKSLAIYGVLAFVIMVIFWGVVNLLASSIGFDGQNVPTPDYLERNGTTFPTSAPSAQSNTAAPTNNNGASSHPPLYHLQIT